MKLRVYAPYFFRARVKCTGFCRSSGIPILENYNE